jgi:hypothetical protein
MQNRKTHYEQVSIEAVEAVLQEATAPAKMPEKPPALLRRARTPMRTRIYKTRENTRSKGQL